MDGYTYAQRLLHWLSALLILLMAATGMAYYFDVLADTAMVAHQWMGQALIVLLVWRIATRLRHGAPTSETHAAWERRLAHITHIGLYLLLAVYLATGYVAASALGDRVLLIPVDRVLARSDMGETLLALHYNLKWVLLAAVALHLAGVVKHAVLDRDRTFARMWVIKKEI